MTRPKKGKRPASKSFPYLNKNNSILSDILIFLIDVPIFIGALLLWPIKTMVKNIPKIEPPKPPTVQFKINVKKHRQNIIKKLNKNKKRLSVSLLRLIKFLQVQQVSLKTGIVTVKEIINIRNITTPINSWVSNQFNLGQKNKTRILRRLKKRIKKLRSKIKLPKITPRPKKIPVTVLARRKISIKQIIIVLVISAAALAMLIFVFIWFSELPNPGLLKTKETPLTTKIYDRNLTLLYQIYASQNRSFIKLNELPKSLINATIAVEDKNFYHHRGVDFKGIIRAAVFNLTANNSHSSFLQGGSSITQQLIKNTLLTPERTVSRKIKEIILAIWTEIIFNKNEILEMYFNQVPYGGTAWGIEAASETYFGKKAKDLNLAESSLLAGLPAAPTLYSPFGLHPELAKKRQTDVLRRMTEDGYITRDIAEQALKEPLNYVPQTIEIKAPHFVMYVKDYLVKKYGTKRVEQGGLSVVTSLDLNLEEMAENEVKKEVDNLKYLLVGNGAAMITNPRNGDILAMVGSKDYFDLENDGNVNVALALRQPGSSIKPVMYAAALEKGYTPSTIIDDAPITYKMFGQLPYSPVNYDGKFHGKVTLRTALGSSFNVPAVKTLNSIGVHTMIEMGRKMGITTWEDESRFGLSLTLGGGEVTMFDLIQAYDVLANYGVKVTLDPIIKITDYQNNIVYDKEKNRQAEQVVSVPIAYQLSNILSDNNARAMAFGYNSLLRITGKTVAVKTGTTNDKKDNWTIGYTPSFAVAVWVGNNDNKPMHPYLTSGVTGAAPIWNKIMSNLLKDIKDEIYQPAKDLKAVAVCSINGMLPCENCPSMVEYFVPGTEPKTHCVITPTPTPSPMP